MGLIHAGIVAQSSLCAVLQKFRCALPRRSLKPRADFRFSCSQLWWVRWRRWEEVSHWRVRRFRGKKRERD